MNYNAVHQQGVNILASLSPMFVLDTHLFDTREAG